MIALSKICSLWWNFWASKNGHCFVMRIHMEVSLRMESGRSDCVKPCFDIAQFGSLYFGFMQSLCENICNGYLYDGDLVFVILKGINCFKFPKRFLEISSRDLTSSFLFCQSLSKLKHPKSPTFGIDALSLCICMAQSLARSQRLPQFIRPMSLLSYTSKTKTVCI